MLVPSMGRGVTPSISTRSTRCPPSDHFSHRRTLPWWSRRTISLHLAVAGAGDVLGGEVVAVGLGAAPVHPLHAGDATSHLGDAGGGVEPTPRDRRRDLQPASRTVDAVDDDDAELHTRGAAGPHREQAAPDHDPGRNEAGETSPWRSPRRRGGPGRLARRDRPRGGHACLRGARIGRVDRRRERGVARVGSRRRHRGGQRRDLRGALRDGRDGRDGRAGGLDARGPQGLAHGVGGRPARGLVERERSVDDRGDRARHLRRHARERPRGLRGGVDEQLRRVVTRRARSRR